MDNATEKIAAVVILYHPDEAVLSNIQTYYPYVQKVYVYDNTELALNTIDWSHFPKAEFHSDGRNKGLAETLNMAAAKATKDGYDWLLTMDQDSYFTQQAIKDYYQCFLEFREKSKIALFGPVFQREDPGWQADGQWQETDTLITSGALLNLRLFNEIGPFDEALFIDSVDYDYCIRAKLAGHRIIQFSTIVMLHELGFVVKRASIKSLFLIKKQKQLHPPLRFYYMFRNLLYLKAKYRHIHVPVLQEIEHGLKNTIRRNLFYGRNNAMLIQYLVLAYKHYKKNQMGRYR